jgi:hypothetical protein
MKATKKQQAQWDLEREQALQEIERRHAIYHGKEFDAIVRWFDALSGEGMVSLRDGSNWYLNFSVIEGIDKNNWQCPTESDRLTLERIQGRPCKVRLYVSAGMVEHCTLTE